jgi:RNA helicase/Putative viral replication protein
MNDLKNCGNLQSQDNNIDKSLSEIKGEKKSKNSEDLTKGVDRYWIFTLNNYTKEDVEIIEELECGIEKEVRGLQCQSEKAPITETKHLQGMIIFNKAQRGKKVKKIIGNNKVNVRRMEGSIKTNINYTSKSKDYDKEADIFITKGTFNVKQGKSAGLSEIIKDLKEGKKIKESIKGKEEAYIRNHVGIKDYRRMHQKDRREKTYTIVRYGQSSTGKSTIWTKDFDSENIYVLKDSNGASIWWDGYDGQELSIIDDYNNNLPLKYMLNLMDHTPMMVDIKGGTTKFNSKKLLITTNKSPLEWFPNIDRESEHYIALLRRIDECWFHARGKEPINVTEILKKEIEKMKEGPYYDKLSGYKNEAYKRIELEKSLENKEETKIEQTKIKISKKNNGTHRECEQHECNYIRNIPCEKHCKKCKNQKECEYHNKEGILENKEIENLLCFESDDEEVIEK